MNQYSSIYISLPTLQDYLSIDNPLKIFIGQIPLYLTNQTNVQHIPKIKLGNEITTASKIMKHTLPKQMNPVIFLLFLSANDPLIPY